MSNRLESNDGWKRAKMSKLGSVVADRRYGHTRASLVSPWLQSWSGRITICAVIPADSNPPPPQGAEARAEPAASVPPVLPPPLPSVKARPNYLPRVLVMLLLGGGLLVLVASLGKFVRAGDSTTAWQSPETGVGYRNERIGRVPWSIHVVRVDRSNKGLGFYAALSENQVLGVSRISEQARIVPADFGRPIAGVNGDFYERDNRTYAGDPRGLQIMRGELVSAPDTVCVWFDRKDVPHLDEVKGNFTVTWPGATRSPIGLNRQRLSDRIVLYTPTYGPSHRMRGGRDFILQRDGSGPWLPLAASRTYRARVREIKETADTALPEDAMVLSVAPEQLNSIPALEPGAVVEISTATTPDLSDVPTAIAGGPALVRDGKPADFTPPRPGQAGSYSERSKYERHPRSAIGWNDQHIFLLTVDGRQAGLSVGMTLAELADYMIKLGCTQGMNLDGGVSATMWLTGHIANSPCQGERTIANALFVVRKAGPAQPYGPPKAGR